MTLSLAQNPVIGYVMAMGDAGLAVPAFIRCKEVQSLVVASKQQITNSCCLLKFEL